MDGRDLARCVATEQAGVEKDSNGNIPDGHFSHNVYTVSKEVGGVYRQERHVYANFNNSRGVRKAMSKAFGEVQFQQVILDYYWMPTVSFLLAIVCICSSFIEFFLNGMFLFIP